MSKIGFVDPNSHFLDVGNTTYILRQVEAAMILSHYINNAYIHNEFEDTYIVAGHMFMPFTVRLDKELQKIVNFMGVIVFPICLSLAMPVLIYNLVLEKELRLLENMKINGLNVSTYWMVTGLYNLILYWGTCVAFWFCGRYIFDISLF